MEILRKKKKFTKKRVFLLDNLILKPFLAHLIQNGIIESDDEEQIDHRPTTNDKINKFISILIKKTWSDGTYDSIIQSLKETEQSHIVDELKSTDVADSELDGKLFYNENVGWMG